MLNHRQCSANMKTFPINLRLENMAVLVVGGGTVAAKKIEKMLPHRPRLTIVSPALAPTVRRLLDEGAAARWIAEHYRAEHLDGQRLVFAATDDPDVNARVCADARARPVLLNAADIPEWCDFILPAVVSGEHFSLALCTGGMAAGYARQFREQLEAGVRSEDDIFALLKAVRAALRRMEQTFDARRDRLWAVLRELEAIENGAGADGRKNRAP
jgi:siroheme synthase-like protein